MIHVVGVVNADYDTTFARGEDTLTILVQAIALGLDISAQVTLDEWIAGVLKTPSRPNDPTAPSRSAWPRRLVPRHRHRRPTNHPAAKRHRGRCR